MWVKKLTCVVSCLPGRFKLAGCSLSEKLEYNSVRSSSKLDSWKISKLFSSSDLIERRLIYDSKRKAFIMQFFLNWQLTMSRLWHHWVHRHQRFLYNSCSWFSISSIEGRPEGSRPQLTWSIFHRPSPISIGLEFPNIPLWPWSIINLRALAYECERAGNGGSIK